MTSSIPPRPVRVILAACVAIACALGLATSVPVTAAAPTDLFFSEYIEGSSNNKALEIYNGTGSAINLGTDGYNVQMHFNGNPVATLTINLTGTVAAGDVFVLAQASAVAAILAQADQTNSSGWFNGDDAVVLRKGTTVLDVIGQIGVDPGTEWGSGLTSTADNTLRRQAALCAGDTNGADAFDPATGWDGFATDTFDGLGAHSETCSAPPVDAAPQVTGTVPASGATDFPVSANLSVTFSEAVNTLANAFTLQCATSGTVAATQSGGPTTFTLDPAADLVSGESCTLTVVAANVSDQDGNDPPDNLAANFTVGFTPFDVCLASFTSIPSIQGSGANAAITGAVTTRGVVVGDFEGDNPVGLRGFYLQDPTGDGDPLTSDGLFVFNGNANAVAAGDVVRVTGTASDFSSQTQISATQIVKCGTGSVAPVDVALPFQTTTDPERYEGMLVRLPQQLVISEYFNLERFGEWVAALPRAGESRLFTPTAVVAPGVGAVALAQENALRQILVDDGLGTQNPSAVRHPNGVAFDLANRFRGGDTVQGIVGILGYSNNRYRVQPTAPATYTPVNDRTAAPEAVSGSMRVAAMNTLNYFLTLDYPNANPPNPLDNKCGPLQNVECRGADADQPLEFSRQRNKLLAALAGLDADVIGLNELENTAGVEPLGDSTSGVVAGLNALLGAGTYAFIDTGVIGTDAIRVGMVYKPSRVAPVGVFKTLDSTVDPRFLDTKNRPSLAQTFESTVNGARFTVVVNHLKSKGSDCLDVSDPDAGDGQGNCNGTRTLAAQALVDWIATDPTGSGDADVLIVGDLNSYAMEDPVTAIRRGADDTAGTVDDYTNLVARYQGAQAYSYVFDAQVGYLDYAIASPSLVGQATGTTEWHINADEPDLLDYDTSFKPPAQDAIYEPNAYRSSDHDPVVVGIEPLRYAFGGFHKLVYDQPAFNSATGGSSIPVKFSLGGDQGMDIFLSGYPRSMQVACDAVAAVVDEGIETANPGSSELSYDPATGLYNYVWKTDKAWRGTCRRLMVVLKDGAVHYVNVLFR